MRKVISSIVLASTISSIGYSISLIGASNNGSATRITGGSIDQTAGTFSGNVTVHEGDYTLNLPNGTDYVAVGTTISVDANSNASFRITGTNGHHITVIWPGETFVFSQILTGDDITAPQRLGENAPVNEGTNNTGSTNNGVNGENNSANTQTPTPTNPITGDNTSGENPDYKVAVPRSKVDYDLTKQATSDTFRLMDKGLNNGEFNLDVKYTGGGHSYKDKAENSDPEYRATSNGVRLSGSKKINNTTIGGGIGYGESSVKYKKDFDGIKEKINSLQLSLGAKQDLTENLDLSGVLTYSNNDHKFKGSDDVKYKSNVLDFQTQLGYKIKGNNDKTYVKPYIGAGVTNVREGEYSIGKVNYGKASETSANATTGVYAQTSLGKMDLYGNVEYQHRFGKKSYHGDRNIEYNGTKVASVKGLDYNRGSINAGLGANYNISDNAKVYAEYALRENKNNMVTLGFESKFDDLGSSNYNSGNNDGRFKVNLDYIHGFGKTRDVDKTVNSQSVFMFSYNTPVAAYDDDYWSEITKIGAPLLPYAVINPWNGPTNEVREEYTNQIARNIAAGIKNLGYVYTSRYQRDINYVFQDIDNYVKFYGENNMAGIFLDELTTGNTAYDVSYMSQVYNYIKQKYPNMILVGNHGGEVSDAISQYADIWLAGEREVDRYLNQWTDRTRFQFEQDPNNAPHLMHIIHSAQPEQYEEIIETARARNVGWVFITTDVQNNPYNDVPKYLEALVFAVNNITPTTGKIAEYAAHDNKVALEIPRSRVDLDLTKLANSTFMKNIDKTKNGELKLDVSYVNGYGEEYKDKKTNVNYDSKSDGVLVSLTKDFGRFSLGGGFGSQKSKIGYKGKFRDVDEKMKVYQIGVTGKYDITDNIDVTAGIAYSRNKHNFTTGLGLGIINDAEYKSNIIDSSVKVGYKYKLQKGMIKPYVGVGVTNVKEGEIERLKAASTSKTTGNASLGVMGELNLGKVDLFGNVEYEQRLGGKGYHNKREYSAKYDYEGLNNASGVINAELGAKYNVSNKFAIKAGYELRDTKKHAAKVSFSSEF